MDFKNVKLDDYCFNLELHKSMFFIDMLKDTYEFTLKGDGVEIFKKIKNGISEPTTRKELIYSIQVEMAEKYEYSSFNKPVALMTWTLLVLKFCGISLLNNDFNFELVSNF